MLPSSAESFRSSKRNLRVKLSPSSIEEGGLHALQSNPGALVGDGLPTASDSRGGPKPATSRTMTATTRAATPFEKAALRNLVRDATCCGLLEALTACIRAWEVSRLALGAFQFVACGNWGCESALHLLRDWSTNWWISTHSPRLSPGQIHVQASADFHLDLKIRKDLEFLTGQRYSIIEVICSTRFLSR